MAVVVLSVTVFHEKPSAAGSACCRNEPPNDLPTTRRHDGTWLSFCFSGAISMDIDSPSGTMIVQFPDTQPLMLGGTGGLSAAVAAV